MDPRKSAPLWLDGLEAQFTAKGDSAYDLFYTLRELERDKVIAFPALLYEMSNGDGCRVHEGLYLSMENDLDDPSQFEGLTLWFGDGPGSVVSMDIAVQLLKLAGAVYCEQFPEDIERVQRNLGRIERRYLADPMGNASA